MPPKYNGIIANVVMDVSIEKSGYNDKSHYCYGYTPGHIVITRFRCIVKTLQPKIPIFYYL